MIVGQPALPRTSVAPDSGDFLPGLQPPAARKKTGTIRFAPGDAGMPLRAARRPQVMQMLLSLV
jgi:hypothetical protein